jgi:hypothetical protein
MRHILCPQHLFRHCQFRPQHPRQAGPQDNGGVRIPCPRSKKTVVIVPSQTSPRSFRNTTSSSPAGRAARAAS